MFRYPSCKRRSNGRRRLELEALEERALMSTLFVVRGDQADGKTHFDTLAGALAAAKQGDTVQIEPNSSPGSGTFIVLSLTIQGDPAFGPSTLPLIPSLTVKGILGSAHLLLNNLALGVVSLGNGTGGAVITHSQVASITELSGPLEGGGSNTINEDVITGTVTLGNSIGGDKGDQVTNNAFESDSNPHSSLLSVNGASNVSIRGNTFTASGANDRAIVYQNSSGSVIRDNTITLSGSFPTFGIHVIEGGSQTEATIQGNRISTNGGVGILTDHQDPGVNLSLEVVENDLVHNEVGLEVQGDQAGKSDDLGFVITEANDFHGYTSSTPAIITQDGSAKTSDGVDVFFSIFSVTNPATVVQPNAGTINAIDTPSADQAFVECLYENFLHRLGSGSELIGWTSLIPSLGRSGVASAIIHSPEAEARLVDQLYLQFLGRPADPGGESFWVKFMQAGHTEENVLAGLLSSNEFYNRSANLANFASPDDPDADLVRALYQTLLGRAGGASEISSWVVQLPSMGRAGVINGITHSLEYRTDQVASFYVNFLHRSGSAKEVAGFATGSLDLLAIETVFAGSNEFFTSG